MRNQQESSASFFLFVNYMSPLLLLWKTNNIDLHYNIKSREFFFQFVSGNTVRAGSSLLLRKQLSLKSRENFHNYISGERMSSFISWLPKSISIHVRTINNNTRLIIRPGAQRPGVFQFDRTGFLKRFVYTRFSMRCVKMSVNGKTRKRLLVCCSFVSFELGFFAVLSRRSSTWRVASSYEYHQSLSLRCIVFHFP